MLGLTTAAAVNNSAIYSGTVWHRRMGSKPHGFRYRVFMMYLDLAELDAVFSINYLWSSRWYALARFKRSDFLGDPQKPLSDEVRAYVQNHLGFRPRGPIRVLANIRYWGFIINPISCYYCFDTTGTQLEAIVLEVTNTPWQERRVYVLPCDSRQSKQCIQFAKAMHVSPFMPMDMQYEFAGAIPGQQLKFQLSNFSHGVKVFSAGVHFRRQAINASSLSRILLSFPLMTLKVYVGIHWQALRLWLKGVKVVAHPSKKRPASVNSIND